jgi:LmbE family N-acetylglucosaminyl deacetylase
MGGGHLSGAQRDAVVALRREESRRAAQVLGTAAPTFGTWQDRQLGAADDLSGYLGELIRATAADVVFAPSLWEVHPRPPRSGLGGAARGERAVSGAGRSARAGVL